MGKKRKKCDTTSDDGAPLQKPLTCLQAKRQDRKDDRAEDNLRNRLIRAFGEQLVAKKDGTVCSQAQKQQEMLIRAFERARGLPQDTGEYIRAASVTARLDKVLLPTNGEAVGARLKEIVGIVSRCRVIATMLANYVHVKLWEAGEPLPQADLDFFKGCLDCVRGSSSKCASQVRGRWEELKDASGLTEVDGDMRGLNAVMIWQAKSMKDAAATLTDTHYDNRIKAMVSWALRKLIVDAYPATPRGEPFKCLLATLTTKGGGSSAPQLRAALVTAGFDAVVDGAEALRGEATRLAATASHHLKRRHLADLQAAYVDGDRSAYEAMWQQLHLEMPGDDNKAARGQASRVRWTYGGKGPPKICSALPHCSSGATFVRFDNDALRQVFPHLESDLQGPWGYRAVINPFARKAKITHFRRGSRYSRSERGFFHAIASAKDPGAKCPWLVGPSFMTDGRQIKIQLKTSARTRPVPPGLDKLHEAGYSQLLSHPGSHRLLSARRRQVHVVDAISAVGSDVRADNIVSLLTESDHIIYTGVEYSEQCLRTAGQDRETVRRKANAAYGTATEALRCRKRTMRSTELIEYCSQWAAHQEDIWQELLHALRLKHTFDRYSKVQSAVEHIAERLCPRRSASGRQRIIFFGAASFKPRRGHASCPCKKLVRVLACRAVVAMTPESGSTCCCPGCGARTTSGPDYRTRMCTATPEDCPLVAASQNVFDRDCGARVTIVVRGVFACCGIYHIVPGFSRGRAAAEEEADDSEED
ncbi:hypothetical protein JKP88DRAFT_246735 [Tribonema minus]|uniref:Uncharacterized protein n=1 Tax=Tribonema minus TaxID=303371 RepID=A0A835YT79_9STRA|nr:hypothetical protein JKP88DRAFT_246735 [Tribonema minus]